MFRLFLGPSKPFFFASFYSTWHGRAKRGVYKDCHSRRLWKFQPTLEKRRVEESCKRIVCALKGRNRTWQTRTGSRGEGCLDSNTRIVACESAPLVDFNGPQ